MKENAFRPEVAANDMLEWASATELLVQYEDEILKGGWPNLDEYVSRYRGSDPENFRVELELAAVLLRAGADERRNPPAAETNALS